MWVYGWMHKIIMQKNVTLYCLLYVDLYYVVCRFISSTSQDRTKLISSTLINHTYLESNFFLLALMTTYLKDLTQSIGRYGGLSWQNWV